jgi:uncharacterized protein (DUF2336 family)
MRLCAVSRKTPYDEAWLYMCRKLEELRELRQKLDWQRSSLEHILRHGKPEEPTCGDG